MTYPYNDDDDNHEWRYNPSDEELNELARSLEDQIDAQMEDTDGFQLMDDLDAFLAKTKDPSERERAIRSSLTKLDLLYGNVSVFHLNALSSLSKELAAQARTQEAACMLLILYQQFEYLFPQMHCRLIEIVEALAKYDEGYALICAKSLARLLLEDYPNRRHALRLANLLAPLLTNLGDESGYTLLNLLRHVRVR